MSDPAIISQAIKAAATAHGLDVQLVAAIVMKESSGDTWRARYEPKFFEQYIHGRLLLDFVPDPEIVSIETERTFRATSWGLMQVMGETAREHGFCEDRLILLLDPVIGCQWGCRVFAFMLKSEDGKKEPALLRWNGGADPAYGRSVLELMTSGKAAGLLL